MSSAVAPANSKIFGNKVKLAIVFTAKDGNMKPAHALKKWRGPTVVHSLGVLLLATMPKVR